jgi:shikimate dehydrogenase
VTIPHKQAVISLLDGLSETAKAIGAVNTIYAQNGRLIGDNTDAAGFWADLSGCIDIGQSKIESQKSAIVLGAGGSARAVVFALKAHGWEVAVAARRIEQAQALVTEFGLQAAQSLDSKTVDFELLVNTTPLGMTPNIETCAWGWGFPPRAFVYDLVYNPPETLLMKRARVAGLSTSNGLGMLIEQAALAFELWTGHPADRTAMRESI